MIRAMTHLRKEVTPQTYPSKYDDAVDELRQFTRRTIYLMVLALSVCLGFATFRLLPSNAAPPITNPLPVIQAVEPIAMAPKKQPVDLITSENIVSFSEFKRYGIHLRADSTILDQVQSVNYQLSNHDIPTSRRTHDSSARSNGFLVYYRSAAPDGAITITITYRDPSAAPTMLHVDGSIDLFQW